MEYLYLKNNKTNMIMKTFKRITLMFVSLILANLFLISCSKDDEAETKTPDNTIASFKGTFVSSAHPTSGTITVNDEKTKLNFINFKTDSGPNLDIYLASDLSNINGDFINLGDIKGLNGNYTYDLAANTDLVKYKYVVIWCIDFNVNFGYATLAL